MNGYSNNGFTQSLNGILTLSDGGGTLISNGEIITGDITGGDITGATITGTSFKGSTVELTGNLTVDNNLTVNGTTKLNIPLKLNCTSAGGSCIDLGAGDTTRTDDFWGTISYRQFGGLVLTGNQGSEQVDIFRNLYVHGTLNIDSNFYLNSILWCNSLSSQTGQNMTLNSGDGQNILIGYYKPYGGKVIINRSCNATNSSVDIEQGNLNVLNGSLNVSSGNANISGNATVTNLKTNNIDIKSGNIVNLYPSATQIYIGDNYTTLTTIKAYLEVTELATFQRGIQCNDSSSFTGINNGSTVDASSLYSAASTIFDGGLIVKKNIYATDVMSNNLVTGNIGCGNLNSSNNITCIKLKSNSIDCNSMTTNDIVYKGKICCNINLGIAPFLSIPLSTSLYDITTNITNFNLQTYLINSNNNSVFIQPYYSIIFYNNDIILQTIDNSSGSNMLYSLITFNLVLTCTKIILQYKNINI